jgi:2-polyprenyl-3-methyl-5-hydroxy-6-metoxy-1,4-benzoquinol methylase
MILLLKKVQEEATRLNRPLRVLDMCCGAGIITSAIGELGHRAVGVDSNAREIKLARTFAQEELLNGIFLHTDLIHDSLWERTTEEILGGKPDVITLAYALHHIPQVDFFIDRISRWVPSGTLLVINEENPSSPLFQIKHLLRTWIQKDTETEHHKTYDEWVKLLESFEFGMDPPLLGADPIPVFQSLKLPELCWSILFAARRK